MFDAGEAKLLINPKAEPNKIGGAAETVLNEKGFQAAKAEITTWPGYAETPLVSLDKYARKLGVKAIYYKDESTRFGLDSFKALGGAYAVCRLLLNKIKEATGKDATTKDLLAGTYKDIVKDITVCSATDGNHGRSVAWGAQMFGAKCVIYIHAGVSEGRKTAIEKYGATVVRCKGNYDDSVHDCADDAAKNGWFVISDTSYPGYMEVPCDVMHGYTVMVDEALTQIPEQPTHTFVQGGVGGLAAAVATRICCRMHKNRPLFTVVEPKNADCLYASIKNDEYTVIHGDLETIMAGLSCGEPSLLALDILKEYATGFMTIPDTLIPVMMRDLANKECAETAVVSGESGVSGLAGLVTACENPEFRKALKLDENSVIILFSSEGATDPEMYREIVGKTAAEVVKG
ncbi:MAG: diaminopropionate ammonia-lyase [Alphaproteobacteria bacterium]|nr:diaminopropionate ammonia-lyase [Alphaproteobacteria bacterium]